MTDREAMQQALEHLDRVMSHGSAVQEAKDILSERLAQPEFPTHEEGDDGWSDWVCPDPKSYLMKCCECGLVHEAQFGVVRYKSETEREDCEKVGDPNLQAVFRMRRSEQWSPVDTAHRAGGLPMEQPAQQPEQEPVAWRWKERINGDFDSWVVTSSDPPPYAIEKQSLYTAPPSRQPLHDMAVFDLADTHLYEGSKNYGVLAFARAIEAAHGIKGEA